VLVVALNLWAQLGSTGPSVKKMPGEHF